MTVSKFFHIEIIVGKRGKKIKHFTYQVGAHKKQPYSLNFSIVGFLLYYEELFQKAKGKILVKK